MVALDANTFLDALEKKTLSASISSEEINHLVSTYPAFNAAYLYQSLWLHQNDKIQFELQLPCLATKVKDRAILHDLIFSPKQSQDTPKEETLKEIETASKNETVAIETTQTENQLLADDTVESILTEGEKIAETNEIELVEKKAESNTQNTKKLTTPTEDKVAEKSKEETKPTEEEEKTTKTVVAESKELTFLAWLKQQNKTSSSKETKIEEIKKTEDKEDLVPFEQPNAIEAEMYQEIKASTDPLEQFISTQIVNRKRKKQKQPKQSKPESQNLALVSETLAEILTLQQKYNEAIDVYSLLSLKYPQKSIYFARQIEKIKTYL